MNLPILFYILFSVRPYYFLVLFHDTQKNRITEITRTTAEMSIGNMLYCFDAYLCSYIIFDLFLYTESDLLVGFFLLPLWPSMADKSCSPTNIDLGGLKKVAIVEMVNDGKQYCHSLALVWFSHSI